MQIRIIKRVKFLAMNLSLFLFQSKNMDSFLLSLRNIMLTKVVCDIHKKIEIL